MKNIHKKTFDYKWVVIAASFIMIFTTLGFCSSTKRLFIGPITEAMGIPRGVYSINDSCRYISLLIMNLFFGTLVAKFGPRKLIGFGFLALIASMLTYSYATNVVMLYVGGGFLGLGLTMTTTSMVGYVVNIWYKEKRGTIMGAILCANGIGGALAMQILNPIVIQDFRLAYRVVAVVLLVVGVFVVAVFRDAPKGTELPQHGARKPKGNTWSGIALKDALKKPYFYSIAICIFLTGMCLQSTVSVDYQHMIDKGMDGNFATWAISIASVALAACKFLVGACNDWKGLKFTMLICSIAAVAMMLMLAFASDSALGRGLAVGYSLFSALALPLETIMLPLIAADLFGEKEYGRIVGVLVSINTAGCAVGPVLTNFVYDKIGLYGPILYVCSGVMVITIIVFLMSQKLANEVKKEVALRETAR